METGKITVRVLAKYQTRSVTCGVIQGEQYFTNMRRFARFGAI